jgi:thiol-disulfide isomerase/thioredoxin
MNARGWRVAGAALITLVAVWGGVRVRSAFTGTSRTEITVPAGVAGGPGAGWSGAGEPLAPETLPPAKIPDRLPAFALDNLTGVSTPVSTWTGKALVINFWATWCAPCRREIPLLKSLAESWSGRDVTVIGIAIDNREKVAEFAEQFKIAYPLLIGEEAGLKVAGEFGMDSPAFPFTVFTDRRGEVVALFVGELHRAQADLILGKVEQLDDGQIQIAAARAAIATGLDALTASPGDS